MGQIFGPDGQEGETQVYAQRRPGARVGASDAMEDSRGAECFGPWTQQDWPLGAPGKMSCPWERARDLTSSTCRLGTQP